MTASTFEKKEDPTRLRPHQAAFVDTVLGLASEDIVVLRGDVGLGKTTAMAAAAARILRDREGARVLILCPPALRIHWAEMLAREGSAAWIIDRYKFREMLDQDAKGPSWPVGAAAIVSDEFAKQPDIQKSLLGVHWDLVVADEAHRFIGARANLLKAMAAANRLVLAVSPGMTLPGGGSLDSSKVIDWRRDQLVDEKGKPIDIQQRPVLLEIRFVQSSAERDLSRTIQALFLALEGEGHAPAFVRSVLFRSLHSSPAALESALRRLTRGEGVDEILIPFPDDDNADAPDAINRVVAGKGREIAKQALSMLEALQVDSKLDKLSAFLSKHAHSDTPPRQVCVLTDYTSTLYYLASEIEGGYIPCQLVHGSMPRDAQQAGLKTFQKTGGVLLATRAVMSDALDPPDVADLVLYDLPHSKLAIQQIFGRFNRIGRVGQLTIHALAPRDAPEGDLHPMRLLREAIE